MRKKTYTSKGEDNVPLNDIGNKELHEKHSVGLEVPEGEKIGRAKVLDQTFMDRLLLEKKIEVRHHVVAEAIYSQAIAAGMFVKTPDMVSVFGYTKKDRYTNALLRYSRTMKGIKEIFGVKGERIVNDLIINDRATDKPEKINFLVEILEHLSVTSL